MSIKILNEGFEKIFSSVKQDKELKEAYDPALKELSSVLLDLSKRIKNGKINCNLKSCADAFQNVIENMYPDKSWWEVTDVNIQNDLFDTQDPEKTALNIIKNIREKSDRKIESLKESEKEPTIKRYSDVRPRSERKYWYFTTHGVQPGSIPRDLNVLEIRDGQNDRGTWGTYVMLDGVLNTSELKKYDMRELVPPMHESKKRRIHERNLTRSERHNRDMEKIFSTKKAQDKKFADFLRKNGYSEEQVDKLQKQDKLSAEIASKFTPKGKQPSDVLGKILGESSKRKSKKSIKESLRRKRLSEDETIKRYSDHVPQEKRKYWYFTTHGVQPGSIPRDLNVLEVRDGQNDKGTWGTFVMLDGILNTSELRKYDMRELAPKEETERRRMRPQGERITAWESLKNKKKNSLLAEKGLTRAERHKRTLKESKWSNKWPRYNFEFEDGWKITAVDEKEAVEKYDDIQKNIHKGASRSSKELDALAQQLYDSNDEWSFNYFSDEELSILWSMCMALSTKAYDDEVYNAITFRPNGKGIFNRAKKIATSSTKKNESCSIKKHKRLKESYDYFETEDAVYSTHNGKHYVHRNEWDKISPAGKYWKQEISLREYTQAYRISEHDKGHSLKESKKLNESFDDMQVFMNTWANYNEYGADGVLTPTGWMSIDDAIEYCEEYADYEPFINDTDNIPFDDINEYSNASSVLQELKELQESDVDEDVVAAIVEATGYSVKEAVEIAESGDYFWYPGLSSYTDLAYAVIDEIGSLKDALGDRVVNYIDEDQMRREYRWDIREIMRETAEDEVDRAHEGEDEDSYDREQEIEDWMDEHEDEWLDMIIGEDIEAAERGEVDLSNYFDYEKFGRDLSFDGYTIVDGGIILVN